MLKHLFITTLFASLCIPILVNAESDVSSSTEIVVTASSSEQELILCKQTAIEKRDTEILSAKNIYNEMMEKSLLARKEAEKKSVAILEEDTKKTATDAAVEAYRTSVKTTQAILTSARQNAWENFITDIKTCTSTIEETTLESISDSKTLLTKQKNNAFGYVKKEKKETSTTEEVTGNEPNLIYQQRDLKSFGDMVIEKINDFKKFFGLTK